MLVNGMLLSWGAGGLKEYAFTGCGRIKDLGGALMCLVGVLGV